MPEFKIQSVVFDFDGVLVQSNAIKRRLFFEVFGAHGIAAPLVEAALLRAENGDRRAIAAAAAAGVGLTGAAAREWIETAVRDYSRRCEDSVTACPSCDGAEQVLDELAACMPVYLNSATPTEALLRVVERRGWARYFTGVFGRPGTKDGHLRRVLDLERLSAQQVLFAGDRQGDYRAAVEVGCAFLGVLSDESDFAPGVPVVSSLAAMMRSAGFSRPVRGR